MLTDGGMTSRIGSFGWSWWTPWMIQWRRAPSPSSGSKWNTRRCIQYSVSVQNRYPPRARPTTSSGLKCGAPTPNMIPMAGTKITSGTTGCTRESLSRMSESNIRGEAESTSARRAFTPSIYQPWPPLRARPLAVGRLSRPVPEAGPAGPQELEPEGCPEAEHDPPGGAPGAAHRLGEHDRQEVAGDRRHERHDERFSWFPLNHAQKDRPPGKMPCNRRVNAE